MWPLFGVVWEAGCVLADVMRDESVEGLRILEVGCGIGLAALVLNHREADITATDRHPEAAGFLSINTALNGGPPIPFERRSWHEPHTDLGRFDLIIGSDLLYDHQHAVELSTFVNRHANPDCEFILIDPGRGRTSKMTKLMVALGYTHSTSRHHREDGPKAMTVHRYQRGIASTDAP